MDESTHDALQHLLSRAQELLKRAQILQAKEAGISGIGKLIKKIQPELAFIKSVSAFLVTSNRCLTCLLRGSFKPAILFSTADRRTS